MATAGNGIVINTAPLTLFDATSGGDGGPCTTYMVKNRSASGGNALINIQGLHASGDFVGVAPGDPPLYFRLGANSIVKVIAKTDAGVATIDHGIVARI